PELPRILGGPPYHLDAFELRLLEALDRALRPRGGLEYRRDRFDETAWRREIVWRLKDLAVLTGRELEPGRWAEVLSSSLAAVLEADRAGEPGARWPSLRAAAERWGRRAEEVHGPGYDRAYDRASWLWKRRRDARRVDLHSRHWLERDPDHEDWLNLRFVLLHHQGRTEEGLALIRRAIRADPGSLKLRLNLAEVLREIGRPEEALREVSTALRIGGWQDRRVWGLLLLAELRLARGERAVARSVLGVALRELEQKPASGEAAALHDRARRLLDRVAR
ncbi:MAG: tetratricopeptide repeat protein, partial [Candidatus Latescibacteria bacterium]|nr:tetratricopeptide repeat protein [Candidatus Latescibacterota bacterium]